MGREESSSLPGQSPLAGHDPSGYSAHRVICEGRVEIRLPSCYLGFTLGYADKAVWLESVNEYLLVGIIICFVPVVFIHVGKWYFWGVYTQWFLRALSFLSA